MDHQPEVTDGPLVERTLRRDVRLASSIVPWHIVGVDVVAVGTVSSVQLHPAVVVCEQVRKPVQLGVDGQLGDRRGEIRP